MALVFEFPYLFYKIIFKCLSFAAIMAKNNRKKLVLVKWHGYKRLWPAVKLSIKDENVSVKDLFGKNKT